MIFNCFQSMRFSNQSDIDRITSIIRRVQCAGTKHVSGSGPGVSTRVWKWRGVTIITTLSIVFCQNTSMSETLTVVFTIVIWWSAHHCFTISTCQTVVHVGPRRKFCTIQTSLIEFTTKFKVVVVYLIGKKDTIRKVWCSYVSNKAYIRTYSRGAVK